MNVSFGKKTDFNFEVSLVEETIPSNNFVWNSWMGNGSSGMDVVSQVNGIGETQLSKGHGKRPKKTTWKIETTWNMIHGMDENAQLNENARQADTIWLHDSRDKSSVTRTQMCSLKVPTAARGNKSCNGPAAPFKTMWTQNGTFGRLEVSDDLSVPDRNPDEKTVRICG